METATNYYWPLWLLLSLGPVQMDGTVQKPVWSTRRVKASHVPKGLRVSETCSVFPMTNMPVKERADCWLRSLMMVRNKHTNKQTNTSSGNQPHHGCCALWEERVYSLRLFLLKGLKMYLNLFYKVLIYWSLSLDQKKKKQEYVA